MAITIETTYSKKLGLPNYSSHSFVVSLRTELSELSQIASESSRLYNLLQQSVDNEVKKVGFLPDATTYGMTGSKLSPVQAPAAGSGVARTRRTSRAEGRAKGVEAAPVIVPRANQTPAESEPWNCSDKQKDLILKLGVQAKMEWKAVENIANLRFTQEVRSLDRKQASILIGALLARRDDIYRMSGTTSR